MEINSKDKTIQKGWPFAGFVSKALEFIQGDAKDLLELMIKADECFKSNGLPGEPLYSSWEQFRPLNLKRATREEDWSDWLAFLIEQSGGHFNRMFFQQDKPCKSRYVQREYSIENRRVDILVTWETGDMLNLEVKIGDTNFPKTYDTAQKIHQKYSNRQVKDLILLPSENLSQWQGIKDEHDISSGITIESITWESAAASIRRSIPLEDNSIFRVIGFIFAAAIEQNILGFLTRDEIAKAIDNRKVPYIIRQQLVYMNGCTGLI